MYYQAYDFICYSSQNLYSVFWHDFCVLIKFELNDKLKINEAFAALKKMTVNEKAANKTRDNVLPQKVGNYL